MSAGGAFDLRAELRERVVLLDGGLGTMLIAAGLGEGEIPEEWNLTRGPALAGPFVYGSLTQGRRKQVPRPDHRCCRSGSH